MAKWLPVKEVASFEGAIVSVEMSHVMHKGKCIDGYRVRAWAWTNMKSTGERLASIDVEAFLPNGSQKQARARAKVLAGELTKSLAYMVLS